MSKSTLFDDLREIAGNMRRQATARMEDTSVEAKSFLSEAMDQYADQIIARIDPEVASDEGNAGTHAYDMLAVAAEREVETTEALIHMVAATVLMLGIDERNVIQTFGQADGSYAITFSPLDMDVMFREYDMRVTREGVSTTVGITKRNEPVLGLTAAPGTDDSEPALPQVVAKSHDRPYWFAKIGPERVGPVERAEAERLVQDSLRIDSTIVAEIENRQCARPECPNPDSQGMCSSCSDI
jgi:hypothetical protein